MAVDFADKVSAFKQISHMRMTNVLNGIPGAKDLVIDIGLMKPLEKFIGVKVLRSYGVDKIFKLDKSEIINSGNTLVYLIRGNLITAKRVCDQISSSNTQKAFLVVFPTAFHSIQVLIEEEGLHGRVTIYSFHWELISIDTRLLSFESPDVFKLGFVMKDGTHTMSCARTLWSMQHVLGKPQFKIFLGSYSKAIHSMMTLLDENVGSPDLIDSELGLLIVVDRNLDYVTPLLTPGTYTSLLDEVIGINCGAVQVSRQDGKIGPPATVLLSNEDETYNQIRHKHFSEVVSYLKQKIKQFYSEQGKRSNMSVKEMQNFVQNDLSKVANSGKILSNHLNLCEKVTNKIGKIFEGLQTTQDNLLRGDSRKEVITFIEDLIATSEDFRLVLRLICLLSTCHNGLNQTEANSLKMQFFHAYGHEHLLTFYNLEKMGLISIAPTIDAPVKLASKVVQAVSMPRKSAFQTTAAKLKLFPEMADNYSLKNPQDLGYVFGGIYIPMIVQIVSSIIKKERNLRDLFKCLPSDFSDSVVMEGKTMDALPEIFPHCVWVYVVGGITYAEVAAFDLLEKKTGCRIICSGSHIINGNFMIDSAI